MTSITLEKSKRITFQVGADEVSNIYSLNELALKYFYHMLAYSDAGKRIGQSYIKERGIVQSSVDVFSIGLANGQNSDFVKIAQGRGFPLELLQKAGLANRFGKDFFRMRIMFPIRDANGRVIGFGGRTIGSVSNSPKYINTPETPVYKKRNVLYGIERAFPKIKELDCCNLVEGYTDVVALHQGGIQNTVSASGTSLTVEQIRAIQQYATKINMLFDGDNAGMKAALRGLNLALREGLLVDIVKLPEGEDPDSYIKKVRWQAFREFLYINAQDFILFRISQLQAFSEKSKDVTKEVAFEKSILESIAHVPDLFRRVGYIKDLAKVSASSYATLMEACNKIRDNII